MTVELDEFEKKKPETVEFYNKIKCGVGVADQMVKQYSVKEGTRRWPVAVFYNILDLAGINAFGSIENERVTRFQEEVFYSSMLQNYVKTILLKDQEETLLLLDLTHYRQLVKNQSRERKQCQVGANVTQNKTSKLCFKFNKTVCGKCTATELSE